MGIPMNNGLQKWGCIVSFDPSLTNAQLQPVWEDFRADLIFHTRTAPWHLHDGTLVVFDNYLRGVMGIPECIRFQLTYGIHHMRFLQEFEPPMFPPLDSSSRPER
jgi:hypothetical protein